ncbi:DUF3871 family protein [Flavobacterium sp.]|uniref:DUF3871 family protein n=1 Tax=Flavobacterium sp. TaxID=239 RepID=UPI003D2844BC
MELITYTPRQQFEETESNQASVESKNKSNFIEANTIKVDLEHLRKECIVPVFSKDNESTISHYEFINSTKNVLQNLMPEKAELSTDIRVSHIVKGRIPKAIGKPAKELLEHEKTIYYERMAFCLEIPQFNQIINGNQLNLVVGGVRSYNQENLYSKKSIEKFKVFVGFQNKVCTNLCISTDGLKEDIRVSSISELETKIIELIMSYSKELHSETMEDFANYIINEEQFAFLIGKMKMYQYLEKSEKAKLFNLLITDSQITSIVRDFYLDQNFRHNKGQIDMWKLYNLFTEANKSSYIDNHLERNVNAYEFIKELIKSLKNKESNWFLHNLYF